MKTKEKLSAARKTALVRLDLELLACIKMQAAQAGRTTKAHMQILLTQAISRRRGGSR